MFALFVIYSWYVVLVASWVERSLHTTNQPPRKLLKFNIQKCCANNIFHLENIFNPGIGRIKLNERSDEKIILSSKSWTMDS